MHADIGLLKQCNFYFVSCLLDIDWHFEKDL